MWSYAGQNVIPRDQKAVFIKKKAQVTLCVPRRPDHAQIGELGDRSIAVFEATIGGHHQGEGARDSRLQKPLGERQSITHWRTLIDEPLVERVLSARSRAERVLKSARFPGMHVHSRSAHLDDTSGEPVVIKVAVGKENIVNVGEVMSGETDA